MKKIGKIFLMALLVCLTGCNNSNCKCTTSGNSNVSSNVKINNIYLGEESLYNYVVYSLSKDLHEINSSEKMLSRCEIDVVMQKTPHFCGSKDVHTGSIGYPEEIGATLSTIKNIKVLYSKEIDSISYTNSYIKELNLIISYEKYGTIEYSEKIVSIIFEKGKEALMKINKNVPYADDETSAETSLAYIIYLFANEWHWGKPA